MSICGSIRLSLDTRENPAAWKHNLDMELPSYETIHVTEHWKAPTLRELHTVSSYLMNGFVYEKMAMFGILTACRNTEFREAMRDEPERTSCSQSPVADKSFQMRTKALRLLCQSR